MAFCGVWTVVMVIVVTEACDCSPVCDDMHQNIVSMMGLVWKLCSSVFYGWNWWRWDAYTDFPACVPVLFLLGSLFDLSLSPPYPRDVFEPKSKDHKVTGSKPVWANMLFCRLPSTWGRPREISEGGAMVKWKIVRWYASKSFPMDLLVGELVGSSRLMWEKVFLNLFIYSNNACSDFAYFNSFSVHTCPDIWNKYGCFNPSPPREGFKP